MVAVLIAGSAGYSVAIVRIAQMVRRRHAAAPKTPAADVEPAGRREHRQIADLGVWAT